MAFHLLNVKLTAYAAEAPCSFSLLTHQRAMLRKQLVLLVSIIQSSSKYGTRNIQKTSHLYQDK
jgi:hypothetical protein